MIPPASLSLYLASSFITLAGSAHKSSGDNVVRMWVQLMTWCVSYVWMLQRGHSEDGCVLSRLCVSMTEEGRFICSEFGKGVTSDVGKYLFRAANVWWRRAQYFVIAYCG